MNHLAGQTSPYLLQHVHNPVDWYPWGEEAIALARSENRPIFLSIGYAACHWCHVMERESFESQAVADRLNAHFVPIKVDREERPDIDEIYMNAIQLMTGSGGWPLSVFLTPELKPFTGGTYFPPQSRHGQIGFADLLDRISELWTGDPARIDEAARNLTDELVRIAAADHGPSDGTQPGRDEIETALSQWSSRFDPRRGGFGAAPKFPPDGALRVLLNEASRCEDPAPATMATRTLDAMALGGLYDHIGGGFTRYSVDADWLVPHFEKMLYNQALLVPAYLDGWQQTRSPLYRQVVEGTLEFVRREMTAPEGGFWSSLDADSEGEEGRFYVWTPSQVGDALGPERGAEYCDAFDITETGNFEGKNIPNQIGRSAADAATHADRFGESSRQLLETRSGRVRPATDDKILSAWNGLMISAFAGAAQQFGHEQDRETARRAATFACNHLLRDGRLIASYRNGSGELMGYLDDYAFLGRGLVDLYETDFDRKWLSHASSLAETITSRFRDADSGTFFFVADDHESLLTRNHSLHDGALPAGSGVAAEFLLRLSVHLDREDLRQVALQALAGLRPAMRAAPSAFASHLIASEYADETAPHVQLSGDPTRADFQALLVEVRKRFLPGCSVTHTETSDGKAQAMVCRDRVCLAPVSDPQALGQQLEAQ